MKKVCILTRYYNNFNYGGLLQAYALQKIIDNQGYLCKQISYYSIREKTNLNHYIRIIFSKRIIHSIIYRIKKLLILFYIPNYTYNTNIWKSYMRKFMKDIEHTKVYTKSSIREVVNDFDIFICGSDQVWNPSWYDEVYFLSFVPDSKIKIAYSASVGRSFILDNDKKLMYPFIKKIPYVSVREKTIQKQLISDLNIDVENTLDPTLLLTASEWDKITDNCKFKDYVFVYLLGDNKKQRLYIQKFAKQLNLKIAYILYMHNTIRVWNERNFGDYRLKKIGPKQFLGLIKNAAYIFTDSFHACVFSIIYHKQFFVYERFKSSAVDCMNSRIEDLLSELGLQEHIVRYNEDISNKNINKEINYDVIDNKLSKWRKASMEFLKNALNNN